MGGGPPSFARGSTCPGLLRIPPGRSAFRVRGFHPLRRAFPEPFRYASRSLMRSIPHGARAVVWPVPLSLAATCGIDVSFSSSGYLDVSVHRVPPVQLLACALHSTVARVCRAGFPHSDTRGSKPMCGSPRIFAACRVLLRRLVPRHPPCALSCLTLQNLPLRASVPAELLWFSFNLGMSPSCLSTRKKLLFRFVLMSFFDI